MKQLFLILLVLILSHSNIFSQAISRSDYLNYLPLVYPKIVEQTDASAKLFLYGDRSAQNYKDQNPIDGIDDERQKVLRKMALKFSPYLVQNTTNVPIDFKVFLHQGSSFPLYVDKWNVSADKPELVDAYIIDFSAIGESDCSRQALQLDPSDQYSMRKSMGNDDCKLVSLLEEFHPDHPRNESFNVAKKSSSKEYFKVMYFDLPGEDPESWKEEYENLYTSQLSIKYHSYVKNYVHPFILDYFDKANKNLLGYELIFQYWFFYPYNDGGNNHEGDWEHINVVISPKDKVERYLTENEIKDLLNGKWMNKKNSSEELVIKRIENYFHFNVMPMDFAKPNVYKPKDEWQNELDDMVIERYGARKIYEHIRYRAYQDDAETKINTHPFIYIGGDNKGLDQLLSMPGGTNRDSHGSYPFAGLYRNIGPAGATEQISNFVDHREYFKNLKLHGERMFQEYKRGNVISFNKDERLEIVPDWERVYDLMLEDKTVRQNYSWFVLPLRWGYPATESPFAGIVKHADTGNQGDIGPAYTEWWNTSMGAAGINVFNPHRIPPIFPLGFQDSFNNSIGFLNVTYPVFFNLPPLDILWRVVVYPFRNLLQRDDPVYYPEKEIPFRFLDVAAGYSTQIIDDKFVSLVVNDKQFNEFILRFVDHFISSGGDSTTIGTSASESLSNPGSPVFQLVFHIGDHFSSENTLRNYRSTYHLGIGFNNIPEYNYTADINFWEYAGSIRYNILTSNLRPYLKVGYGWNWYRVENAAANGVTFTTPNSDWFNQPSFKSFSSILPNTFHIGGGFEWIILKSYAQIPKGIDISIRAEYALFAQNLGLDLTKISLQNLSLLFSSLGDVPQSGTVNRHVFSFVLSVGF